jgi:hypothetical protein
VKRGRGREITCPEVAAWYGSDHPALRSFLKQVLLLLWGCNGCYVGGGRRALDPFFRGEEEGTVVAWGRAGVGGLGRYSWPRGGGLFFSFCLRVSRAAARSPGLVLTFLFWSVGPRGDNLFRPAAPSH